MLRTAALRLGRITGVQVHAGAGAGPLEGVVADGLGLVAANVADVQLVIGVIDAGAVDQGDPRVAILEDRAVGGDLAQRIN